MNLVNQVLGHFLFGSVIKLLLEGATGIWNYCVSTCIELLTVSPSVYKGGGVWDFIMKIEPVMGTIGASLLSLLFIATFCKESLDLKKDLDWKTAAWLLVRLVIGNGLMINYVKIIKGLFQIGGGMLQIIGTMDALEMQLSEGLQSSLDNVSIFTENFMTVIFGIIIFLVIVICGMTLIYIAIYRLFKVFVILPFGPIAFATMAGTDQISATGVAYFKTMLTLIFEPVIMVMALAVSGIICSTGFGFVEAIPIDGWIKIILQSLDMVMTCGICVGSVKGAESILKRAFNLN